jgi:hypothetical protein
MFHRVKIVLATVLTLLLFQGCGPDDVIPRKDMEEILSEFYLADAVIETLNSSRSDTRENPDSMRVYQPIIEKHGYSKEMFLSSLDYYLHHSDELSKIFHNVHVNLLRQADMKAQQDVIERANEEETDAGPGDAVLPEGAEPDIEMMDAPSGPEKGKPLIKEKKEDRLRKEVRPKKKKMTKDDLKRLEEELK